MLDGDDDVTSNKYHHKTSKTHPYSSKTPRREKPPLAGYVATSSGDNATDNDVKSKNNVVVGMAMVTPRYSSSPRRRRNPSGSSTVTTRSELSMASEKLISFANKPSNDNVRMYRDISGSLIVPTPAARTTSPTLISPQPPTFVVIEKTMGKQSMLIRWTPPVMDMVSNTSLISYKYIEKNIEK